MLHCHWGFTDSDKDPHAKVGVKLQFNASLKPNSSLSFDVNFFYFQTNSEGSGDSSAQAASANLADESGRLQQMTNPTDP